MLRNRQLTPIREQIIPYHMQLGDSTVTTPLTDLAKSLLDVIIFEYILSLYSFYPQLFKSIWISLAT